MSNKKTQIFLPPPVIDGMVDFKISADAVPDHGVVISASYPDNTAQDRITVYLQNIGPPYPAPHYPYFNAAFWSSSGKARCAIPKEIILTAKDRGNLTLYYEVVYSDSRKGMSNMILFSVV